MNLHCVGVYYIIYKVWQATLQHCENMGTKTRLKASFG